jgi:5-methylcytosine-specific restriction endonuclease McrA
MLAKIRREAGAVAVGAVMTCAECGDAFKYRSGPQSRCAKCQRANKGSKIHEWLKANPDKTAAYRAVAKDNYDFGGNRQAALERDGFTCQRCGSTDDLHVHHRDGRGTTTPREERNNALENLQTLCRGCHTATHWEEKRAH